MSYLSPLMTLMLNGVKKATSSLDRDFSEIERLQSSVKPYQDFVRNAYGRIAQNLRVELGKIKPNALIIEDDIKSIPNQDCFLVRTIDALENFSRGIALFATTIVFCEKGAPKAALLYNRVSDELYFAEKGNGAYKEGFRNHERLRVSANKEKSLALTSLMIGYENGTPEFDKAAKKAVAFAANRRNFGSVAASLATVAAGKCDLAVCWGTDFVATLAGLLLVKEAGGYIYNLDVKDVEPQKLEDVLSAKNWVAANNNFGDLVKTLK